jgi:hypothetical protein
MLNVHDVSLYFSYSYRYVDSKSEAIKQIMADCGRQPQTERVNSESHLE